MKFKLKQEKLQEMLEKLLMRDIFPSSIIMTTKEGILKSIQEEDHRRALRFAKFNSSFFETIEHEADVVEINVEEALKLIKLVPAGTSITVEKKGTKLSFTDDKGTTYLQYKEPEGKILENLPFEMKDGLPTIGDGKVPLDTWFTLDLADLKVITSYGTSLKTEFYKFLVNSDNSQTVLTTRIGELHDFSNYREHKPKSKVLKGENLEVYFTYGISQIADIFRQSEIVIKTRTHSPGFVSETDKEKTYTLGILIPPFTE